MASASSSPLPTTIRLKLCYLARTKIFAISPDFTLSQLIDLVALAFPDTSPASRKSPATLELAYLDKEADTVIIDSDESLRFALLDLSCPDTYLKVQVHLKLQQDDREDILLRDEGSRSRHGQRPVSICRHFKAGFCKFRSSCRFSHDTQNRDIRMSFDAIARAASPFRRPMQAIQNWLINQQQASGSENVLNLSSANGFEEMNSFLNHSNLSAEIIHQVVLLLTRQEIRTTLLRQATNKIYGALVGSLFLTRLHAHIRGSLEPTAAYIQPYVALTEELVGRTSNGWKEAPLDELKMAVDELQTDDEATRELRYAIARLLEQRQKKKRLNAANDGADALSESTAFRDLQIIPSKEQLICNNTDHLPLNRIGSMYPNVTAYLDTHFRLMQEDCIAGLREGVQLLRRSSTTPDLRVYTNARLVDIQCGNQGIVYSMKFSANVRGDMDWESSKRLMFGSLLCISHDRFQTFLWAVIANRSPQKLSQGVVGVEVLKGSDQTLKTNREYTMVESSSAYFGAYSHVLKNLQRPDMDNLPFQEHLLSLEPNVQDPSYLKSRKDQDIYDFGNVFPHLPKELANSKLHILQDWPQWTSSLDTSQLAALKHGLTKRLALIQGPPGTGKTFIGLLIVRILLENLKGDIIPRTIWQSPNISSESTIKGPIFIVCYTNHALDQFLKGIWEHEKNIIRIGGRHKSQELTECNLQALRKQKIANRCLPPRLCEESGQAWRCKKTLEEIISGHVHLLNGKLATIESLQGIATEDQIQSLFFEGCNKETIVKFWLNEGEKGSTEERRANFQSDHNEIAMHNPYTFLNDLDNTDETSYSEADYSKNHVSQREIEAHGKGNGFLKSSLRLESGAESCREGDVFMDLKKKARDEDGYSEAESAQNYVSQGDIQFHDQGNGFLESSLNLEYGDGSCTEGDYFLNILEKAVRDDRTSKTDNYDAKFDPTPESNQGQSENRARNTDETVNFQENSNRMTTQNNRLVDVQAKQSREFTEVRTKKRSGGKPATDNYTEIIADRKRNMQDDDLPLEILVNHRDVWSLNRRDRRKLHDYWLEEIRNDAQNNIAPVSAEYELACRRKLEIDNEIELHLLWQAKVVGMTTTAAARCHTLLESLRAEIVIVEEAAEVLESHILASITSSTKHLILIGDHLQLRPSVAVYRLAVEHHLDVSLFERLVKGGIEFVTLEVQRRMSPCISRLISSLYPMLKDHESVLSHENVKGIQSNVFFLNHKALEGQKGDDNSGKVNVEEAKIVVELCAYLLKQGYNSTDITILSMYKGQIREILHRLTLKLRWKSSDNDSVEKQMPRVSSVDDYQGEECKIIILSLVRSNHIPSKDGPGRIGFLNVSNRICVALSRARNGLFILGNGNLLAEKSDQWKTVIQELQRSGSYGNELTLCCQNHPGTHTKVCKPNDFQEVADGGCNRSCDYQLGCGHVCPLRCHPDDHSKVVCPKRCPRKFLSCSHRCQSLCHGSTECPPCQEQVYKELPACGHSQRVTCSSLIESVVCRTPCQRVLACGHKCHASCGKACTSVCFEPVEKSLPCGHVAKIACHQDPEKYICRVPCRSILSPGCAHTCTGTCGACKQGKEHIPCLQKCGRILPCGHSCRYDCCKVCPPCPMPCHKRCLHSRCRRRCGDACVPCMEPCAWNCEHHCCGLLCYELCSRPRCNEPCKKILKCGHPCLGLCGELCPFICRICTPQYKDIFSQMTMEDFEEADRFVQLQDCGHVFEVSGLDTWMHMEEPESGTHAIKPKQCPECKTPVSQSLRYGNDVKAKFNESEELKKHIHGFDLTNEGSRYLREKKYTEAEEKFEAAINRNPANFEAHFGLGNALCFQSKFNLAVGHFYVVVKHSSFSYAAERLKPGLAMSFQRLLVSQVNSRAYSSLALDALIQWASALANLKNFPAAINACDIVLQAQPDNMKASEIRDLASKGESAEVVEAMMPEVGGRGHWYKCPNGHLYVVGECGGPMQISTCPDCKAVVGGDNHTPAPGNVHSNIDGSSHSAWSNRTGLGNHRLLQPWYGNIL